MSTYTDIGAAEAEAELAVAQAIGVQISLSHRGASANTLYAILNDIQLSAERPQPMRSAEVQEISLTIPNQTNFTASITTAAKPVTKGDRIEYPLSSGVYFWIQNDEAIECISNGYIYKVKAASRKTTALGTKS